MPSSRSSRGRLIRFNALQGEPTTDKVTLIAAMVHLPGFSVPRPLADPYGIKYTKLSRRKRAGSHGITVGGRGHGPGRRPEGLLNHKIVIKTSSEKAAQVPITITGVVRPIIQVIPPEINFGTVPGDAPVGRNIILINNRQGTQLELTSAR